VPIFKDICNVISFIEQAMYLKIANGLFFLVEARITNPRQPIAEHFGVC
jgi:hypothetical protein